MVWGGALAPGALLVAIAVFAGPSDLGLPAWAQAHWWITLIRGAAVGAAVDIATRIRARNGSR